MNRLSHDSNSLCSSSRSKVDYRLAKILLSCEIFVVYVSTKLMILVQPAVLSIHDAHQKILCEDTIVTRQVGHIFVEFKIVRLQSEQTHL